MQTIKISGTDDTPGVILDKENGLFQITGRSLPEDVAAFFEPILEWMAAYAEDPLEKTIFDFKLSYFNTASSKLLLDVLLNLEEMVEEGHDVTVRWYYPEDDEDMEEAGEEYADIVEVPFEQISYSLD
ncbi:MAG: nuclear pore complex subunit [Marinilabiliales bacterium]|nr:MAG: nuclear pore complex subunit [Marinilabiliales bacterium]